MNIQQLRAQIAALQDSTMDENKNFRSTYDEGKFDALSAVDALLDSVQEEHVSEDLEKAAKDYSNNLDNICGSIGKQTRNAFKAGANWQREKDESTTEDLGKYINELSKQFPEVSFAKLSRIAVRVAKWQKEQMMAKAIDGDITFDYYGYDDKTYGYIAHDSFCLEDFGLKDRDKVKVIVIKED